MMWYLVCRWEEFLRVILADIFVEVAFEHTRDYFLLLLKKLVLVYDRINVLLTTNSLLFHYVIIWLECYYGHFYF